MHSHLARLLQTCHKIAIVNHAIACYEKGKASHVIDAESYVYAFPWCQFFAENIAKCYRVLTSDTDISEQKLLGILAENGKERKDAPGILRITLSKLARFSHLKIKDLNEIIDTLEVKQFCQRVRRGKSQIYIDMPK